MDTVASLDLNGKPDCGAVGSPIVPNFNARDAVFLAVAIGETPQDKSLYKNRVTLSSLSDTVAAGMGAESAVPSTGAENNRKRNRKSKTFKAISSRMQARASVVSVRDRLSKLSQFTGTTRFDNLSVISGDNVSLKVSGSIGDRTLSMKVPFGNYIEE